MDKEDKDNDDKEHYIYDFHISIVAHKLQDMEDNPQHSTSYDTGDVHTNAADYSACRT